MTSKFDHVFKEAVTTYKLVVEQDVAVPPAGNAPQQPGAQPQAAAPQDAAIAQPQQPDQGSETNVDAGYDIFKTIIIKLLRILNQTAGAVQSNDSERLQAVRNAIPDNIEDDINLTISQITTADPAKVEQQTRGILDALSSNNLQ